jgi:DNA helicase-2/ATP-dependent DNA helicase PcrA
LTRPLRTSSATRRHVPPADSALLASLNPAQRDAASTTEGPLLVLAGAGTGKTRVITTRIAYLLSLGVDPSSILAVTFTNKAAGEMKERVAHLAGDRAREVTVGTFHAFCARVLREHGPALGHSRRFTICDASDQLSAVKSAMRELRVHETTMHPSAVLARISLAKNRMETPESFLESGSGGRDQLVGSVWQRYREPLAAVFGPEEMLDQARHGGSESPADAKGVAEQGPLLHLRRQHERPPAVRDPRVGE